MTKTEKAILERIRAANDSGCGVYSHHVIGETKGKYGGWRRGRVGVEPKKADITALARLVERGDIEVRHGRHYVANHPALAGETECILRCARAIDQQRAALVAAERAYAEELAFLQRWWGK